MSVNTAKVLVRMFGDISSAIDAEKDRLTALDGAIGDADHGITMSLGFNAVTMELASMDLDHERGGAILTRAAAAFLNAVGASTGPLYASAFLRAAKVLEPEDTLTTLNQVRLIEALTLGIRERGKGQLGDKTMLDAWIPAMEAAAGAKARDLSPDQMWREITDAADAGAQATASMIAARGRSARLGERSLGHIDPGAASAAIILRAMKTSFLTVEPTELCDPLGAV